MQFDETTSPPAATPEALTKAAANLDRADVQEYLAAEGLLGWLEGSARKKRPKA